MWEIPGSHHFLSIPGLGSRWPCSPMWCRSQRHTYISQCRSGRQWPLPGRLTLASSPDFLSTFPSRLGWICTPRSLWLLGGYLLALSSPALRSASLHARKKTEMEKEKKQHLTIKAISCALYYKGKCFQRKACPKPTTIYEMQLRYFKV